MPFTLPPLPYAFDALEPYIDKMTMEIHHGEYWVRHFEERGLAGLVEGARPGRPQRLSQAQRQEVETVLRGAPSQVGLSGTRWEGKTLQVWLARRYGVRLGVRQCQRRFRQFGFRLPKPRPLIAHADPVLQKRHKKTPGVKP